MINLEWLTMLLLFLSVVDFFFFFFSLLFESKTILWSLLLSVPSCSNHSNPFQSLRENVLTSLDSFESHFCRLVRTCLVLPSCRCRMKGWVRWAALFYEGKRWLNLEPGTDSMQRDGGLLLQVFIRICPQYRFVCPRDAAFLFFAFSSFFYFY